MGNTLGIPLALLKLQFTAWFAAGSKLQPSGKALETVTGPVKITFAVAGTGVVPLTLLMVTLKVAVDPPGAAFGGAGEDVIATSRLALPVSAPAFSGTF